MSQRDSRHFWSGFFLGHEAWARSSAAYWAWWRDIATAALFGLGESGVMDAFVIAFRIANVGAAHFRRGVRRRALPVFAVEFEASPRAHGN